MEPLITQQHSLVLSFAGVADLGRFRDVVASTAALDRVGAYQVDFSLGLSCGLERVASCARALTPKPLIYDHQRAGSGPPQEGVHFAHVVADAGFSGAILYPLAGPETQRAWTAACLDRGLHVLCGGYMTHPRYVASEGGYVLDAAVEAMFTHAAEQGVRAFFVPGTHPAVVGRLRHHLAHAAGVYHPTFFVNGFHHVSAFPSTIPQHTQGLSWHAVVDRAVTSSADPAHVICEYLSRLP